MHVSFSSRVQMKLITYLSRLVESQHKDTRDIMTSLATSDTEALRLEELSRARRLLLRQLSSAWWLHLDSRWLWHCTSYTDLCMKMDQPSPQWLVGVEVSSWILICEITSLPQCFLHTTGYKSSHEWPSISPKTMYICNLSEQPPTNRFTDFLPKLTILEKQEKTNVKVTLR